MTDPAAGSVGERGLLQLARALAVLEATSRSLLACRDREEIVSVLRGGLAEPLGVESLALYALSEDSVVRRAQSPEGADLPEHLALVGANGRALVGGGEPAAIPVRLGTDDSAGYAETLRGPEGPVGVLLLRRKAGAAPLTDARQTLLALIADQTAAVFRSVELMDELRRRALFDDLTGAAARGHFLTQLRREISRARRNSGALSVLVLDADHFKAVNDGHGHAAGDAVLKALVGALLAGTRESDLVGRIGGEEFAVLLPEADRDGAAVVAERLRAAVETTSVPVGGVPLRVTVSVGAATWGDAVGPEELLNAADGALYAAKAAGRNRVRIA